MPKGTKRTSGTRSGTATRKPPTRKSPTRRRSASAEAAKSLSLVVRTVRAAASRNRRRAEAALDVISRGAPNLGETFYEVALALVVLQRPELHAALGCASFEEVIDSRTPLSRVLAVELARLPAHLSREAALVLGREQSLVVAARVGDGEDDDTQLVVSARRRRTIDSATSAASAAHVLEGRLGVTAKGDVAIVPVRRDGQWRLRVDVPLAIGKRLDTKR